MRVAILINFIAGWALLPSASYAPTNDIFPYWILATSLPTGYFFTKASITGITALIGIVVFDREAFSRFRPSLWDIPILVWCAAPLMSAMTNPDVFAPGLIADLYQLLAWGVPYLCGRLYFTDAESLKLAAKAFVIGGLAYVPICLIEIVVGPQLYAHLYGFEPYRWVGAQRYIGYRPIGFMEDGNQLGIWMATAALIAAGLWKRRTVDRVLGIPIAIVAAVLFFVTLLCQSGGSILLLFALLPFVLINQRRLPRVLTAVLLVGILFFAGLRLANVVSLRSIAENNPVAHHAANFLKKIERGSMGWRLAEDERHVSTALQSPIFGSGQWDWWKGGIDRPWGLWLLAFGMFGIIGLAGLESLLLVPVARVVWLPAGKEGGNEEKDAYNLRYTLAAAILMTAVDSLLNGAVILPLLLVIGSLSGTIGKLAAKPNINQAGGSGFPSRRR
jgi:hypothetical protein